MASSQQKQTQSEKSQGWGPAMGQIQQSLPQVEGLYNQRLGQQFFPGQTYAGFDPSQTEALGNIEGIARGGGGVTGDALNLTRDTLQGKYLDAGNPHFGLMAGRIRDQVLPSITSQWAKAGRGTGNLDVVGAAGQGVGDAVGALAYQNYGDERNRMMQASGMAPMLDQARYADSDRLWAAGAERQGMDQKAIQEAMMRYQFDQDKEGNALKEKLGILHPLATLGKEGTSSSTTTTTPSPLQTAMQGAMMVGGAAMGMPGMGMGGGSPMMQMMQQQNMGGVWSPYAGQQKLPWM